MMMMIIEFDFFLYRIQNRYKKNVYLMNEWEPIKNKKKHRCHPLLNHHHHHQNDEYLLSSSFTCIS